MIIVCELDSECVLTSRNVGPDVFLGRLRVVRPLLRDGRFTILRRDLADIQVVVDVTLALLGRLVYLVDHVELLNFHGDLYVADVERGPFGRLHDLHTPIRAFAAACHRRRREDNDSQHTRYELPARATKIPHGTPPHPAANHLFRSILPSAEFEPLCTCQRGGLQSSITHHRLPTKALARIPGHADDDAARRRPGGRYGPRLVPACGWGALEVCSYGADKHRQVVGKEKRPRLTAGRFRGK